METGRASTATPPAKVANNCGGLQQAWYGHHQPRFLRVSKQEGKYMLWTIFVILLVLWLLGFSFHVAGGLIHLLLVVAVVVLLINLLSGRRTVV
jgi:hypothetical protein